LIAGHYHARQVLAVVLAGHSHRPFSPSNIFATHAAAMRRRGRSAIDETEVMRAALAIA